MDWRTHVRYMATAAESKAAFVEHRKAFRWSHTAITELIRYIVVYIYREVNVGKNRIKNTIVQVTMSTEVIV